MPERPQDWIAALPKDRLVAEFSVWSADLARLADDLARIDAHADILHIDVADGHFAPSLLFFPDLVAAVRKLSRRPIHVHLMVDDSILLSQVEQFIEAGSDLISLHAENAAVADAALDLLAQRGVAAGVMLQVETPVDVIRHYLPRLSFVTLLGTAIGVKGKGLDAQAENRLRQAAQIIRDGDIGHRIVLAADDGIREHTVPLLRQAGAEAVVLGSLAFTAPSLDERMAWLHSL